MCFRPADTHVNTSSTNKCPSCGKTIQSMGGAVMKSCPFCHEPFGFDMAPTTISAIGTKPTPQGSPKPPAA